MAPTVPRDPLDIDSTWLAEILARQHPDEAPVEILSLAVRPAGKWNVAETAFLDLSYAGAKTLPRSLFVKLSPSGDPLAQIFPGERRFYADAPAEGLPLARCHGTAEDPATGATAILLEDLRDSHEPTPWPLPPTLPRCHQAVRALARIHAYWQQPADATLAPREAELDRQVAALLPELLTDLGDRLPEDRAQRLTEVCRRLPELKAARYRSGPVTRSHGDAHVWNVLYPRDPDAAEAVLIDWEDWRVDVGAADLALMMALHWYPDRRARHERALLEDYLDTFNAHAADPMGRDDLWRDYRLGHLCNAPVPVFQHAAGRPHASWWSHLERWFLAFEDLGCDALL